MVRPFLIVALAGCFALQASASLLRAHNTQTKLFGACTNVGLQCRAPNSVCSLLPAASTRTKRDVQVEVDSAEPVNELKDTPPATAPAARDSGGYKEDDNNNDNNDNSTPAPYKPQAPPQSSGAYRHKNIYKGTVDLGTTYSRSQETQYSKSRSDKYKKFNSWSRIDTHLNTVKKHVHTHTINQVYQPKQVLHIEKNHLLTVVNHKYPKEINVKVTRWRKIVKPVKAVEIVRNYDKQVKYQVAPTKYENLEKTVRLDTVWVPTKNLGIVSDVKGRMPQPSAYEMKQQQTPYQQQEQTPYQQQQQNTYATNNNLYQRSALPTPPVLDRFKRDTEVTAQEFSPIPRDFGAASTSGNDYMNDNNNNGNGDYNNTSDTNSGGATWVGDSDTNTNAGGYNANTNADTNQYQTSSPVYQTDTSNNNNNAAYQDTTSNTNAPQSSGAYKNENVWKGTVDLGTTYSQSENTKYAESRSDKWKKENNWKRIDTHLNTVKKHVYTHTTNYVEKPKEVTHVEKNYLLTVVNHKYPKEINVKVNKYRKIVKPEKATEIVRNYDKKVEYVVAPTKYENEEKTVKLDTVWAPTKDLGVVSDTVGRKEQPSAYEKPKMENLYERSSVVSVVAAPAASTTVDRFKRDAEQYDAACLCAETFVPSADMSGCECPQGTVIQADGYCN